MLKLGPNPYGLCCTLGLQGKAEQPKDLWWFIELAEKIKGSSIEFHCLHLAEAEDRTLASIRDRLEASDIEPIISGPWPLSRITEAIPVAHKLGVRTVRTHLSPILCGARAEQGEKWNEIVSDIRFRLADLGPRFADEGLTLAIENHQDFGSEELLEFCEIGGDAVGITLDTGNPLAVCEDPIAFVTRVAERVRHLHLKDYQAQPTPDGFRLIRCPIGDGAIPFLHIERILSQHHRELTATLEPGALDSRHVKLLTANWWEGYQSRSVEERQACLDATKHNSISPDVDARTPWERGEDAEAVCHFEMEQFMKSVRNMQLIGWLPV